eukprot:gb/GFBE01056789.1/.p1 GENE.gb/GFBE01056789.1/~~gb/GFBE01056789.1/.p1  ORF type:complete len:508 (+),score=96.96 gb/GFBE01056789.1/:1-1524(+)
MFRIGQIAGGSRMRPHGVPFPFAIQRDDYFCCWLSGCESRRFPSGLGSQGWQTAGVVEQLLAALPSQLDSKPSSESASKAGSDFGSVHGARSPRQLTAAYEELALLLGEGGNAAGAAAACIAANYVNRQFSSAKLRELENRPFTVADFMDLCDNSVHHYKLLRIKIAAWSKQCGDATAIADALHGLPVPALPELSVDAEDLARQLRAASENDAALQAIVECPVCYNMIFEPVTTPCGHTFCKSCLARTLDFGRDCPLCRGSLAGQIEHYAACDALQELLKALWPDVHSLQLKELEDERREHRQGLWLPIMLPLLALPTQPCNLQVVMPEHRLMLRQTLSMGQRRIGACDRRNDGQLFEYGTELVLQSHHVLPTGASLMEAKGARRFRVIKSVEKEGYVKAQVEYLTDTDATGAEGGVHEFLTRLRGRASLLSSLLGLPIEELLQDDHAKTQKKCDVLAWSLLALLPMPAEEKRKFLEMSSKEERLLAMAQILRDMVAEVTWSDPSAA